MSYIRCIPVESSNIKAIGYDRRTNTLRVIFHHGGGYDYPNVADSVVLDLLFADSIGSFFSRVIKPAFQHRKVGEQELQPPEAQPPLMEG